MPWKPHQAGILPFMSKDSEDSRARTPADLSIADITNAPSSPNTQAMLSTAALSATAALPTSAATSHATATSSKPIYPKRLVFPAPLSLRREGAKSIFSWDTRKWSKISMTRDQWTPDNPLPIQVDQDVERMAQALMTACLTDMAAPLDPCHKSKIYFVVEAFNHYRKDYALLQEKNVNLVWQVLDFDTEIAYLREKLAEANAAGWSTLPHARPVYDLETKDLPTTFSGTLNVGGVTFDGETAKRIFEAAAANRVSDYRSRINEFSATLAAQDGEITRLKGLNAEIKIDLAKRTRDQRAQALDVEDSLRGQSDRFRGDNKKLKDRIKELITIVNAKETSLCEHEAEISRLEQIVVDRETELTELLELSGSDRFSYSDSARPKSPISTESSWNPCAPMSFDSAAAPLSSKTSFAESVHPLTPLTARKRGRQDEIGSSLQALELMGRSPTRIPTPIATNLGVTTRRRERSSSSLSTVVRISKSLPVQSSQNQPAHAQNQQVQISPVQTARVPASPTQNSQAQACPPQKPQHQTSPSQSQLTESSQSRSTSVQPLSPQLMSGVVNDDPA